MFLSLIERVYLRGRRYIQAGYLGVFVRNDTDGIVRATIASNNDTDDAFLTDQAVEAATYNASFVVGWHYHRSHVFSPFKASQRP